MLGPPSQGWKKFLRNHAKDIVAIDMLSVPTLAFERLYAFVVIGHGRREIFVDRGDLMIPRRNGSLSN